LTCCLFSEGRFLEFLHEMLFWSRGFWHRGFKLEVFRHSDFTQKGFELDLFQIAQTCGSRMFNLASTAENCGLVHISSPATGNIISTLQTGWFKGRVAAGCQRLSRRQTSGVEITLVISTPWGNTVIHHPTLLVKQRLVQ